VGVTAGTPWKAGEQAVAQQLSERARTSRQREPGFVAHAVFWRKLPGQQ